MKTPPRNHSLLPQYQYESCKLRGQSKSAAKKSQTHALEVEALTEAGVGPALAEVGRFHQEHAGLMSHPRAENQQQSSQHDATLQGEKRGQRQRERGRQHPAQPYHRR